MSRLRAPNTLRPVRSAWRQEAFALLRYCGPPPAVERKAGNAEERRSTWPEPLECALGERRTRLRDDRGRCARAWDSPRGERGRERQQLEVEAGGLHGVHDKRSCQRCAGE